MCRVKFKIMIVEDNPVTACLESALLARNGYEVIEVSSGEAAIDVMKSGIKIDLVLMDVDLGEGISGIDAASLISEEYPVPVIFYTAHDELDVLLSADKITGFGYIPKKSCNAEVLEIIENILFVTKNFYDYNTLQINS